MRARILMLVVALVVFAGPSARADKVDELTRTLLQESSYKVRVQVAVILGKLKDPRAVAALSQAVLHDDNASVRSTAANSLGQIGDPAAKAALESATQDVDGYVRGMATAALARLGSGGAKPPNTGPHGVAKFYLAIGFQGGGKQAEASQMVRDALAKELQKLPGVTLTVGAGEPTAAVLAQRKLQGYIVDGTITRLSATLAGGSSQIDCDLKAFVATYPGKSIKMMTTEGASLQASASERESAKRDCIAAAAESIRDDVGKYLKTVE